MDWMQMFGAFGWLFFCIGMVQPQSSDLTFKEKFNIVFLLLLIHQRALIVPFRFRWGTQALGGFPTALAIVLIFIWWMVTGDGFMFYWLCLWFAALILNRIQALVLASKTHSQWDGLSVGEILGCSTRLSKLIIEPLMFGALGWYVWDYYESMGLRPSGLPYFFLGGGCFSLPFTELIKQAAWDRRIQSMQDGRLEQQVMMEEYQQRYGR